VAGYTARTAEATTSHGVVIGGEESGGLTW
jgi:hypothetical protein